MASPAVRRELRRLDTMPYKELPEVIFKEEIHFLFEDRERLRQQLDKQERRHTSTLRDIKHKLAGLRNEVLKQRNYCVVSKKGYVGGFDAVLAHLNPIVKGIRP